MTLATFPPFFAEQVSNEPATVVVFGRTR